MTVETYPLSSINQILDKSQSTRNGVNDTFENEISARLQITLGKEVALIYLILKQLESCEKTVTLCSIATIQLIVSGTYNDIYHSN